MDIQPNGIFPKAVYTYTVEATLISVLQGVKRAHIQPRENPMKKLTSDEQIPAFQRVKTYVRDRIREGVWKEGDLIPSEEALAREFGVARMTVNRAIRELSAEQIVERVRGSGTYVAQQKYQATLVAIRNIADEISARGHRHRSELQLLERTRADEALARRFGIKAGDGLFHSVVVHFEDDQPIQVEDRYVNPSVAPDYLAQNFNNQTPNAYLMRVAPLQGVSFEIEACKPPKHIGAMLQMPAQEPCLVLHRRTNSLGQVASVAIMWYPASRYRFTGEFEA